MNIIKFPQKNTWKTLLERPTIDFLEIESRIKVILTDIQTQGDEAAYRFNAQYDKNFDKNFLVSAQEIAQAHTLLSKELKDAILMAKNNIQTFHEIQKNEIQKVETMSGVVCWRKSVAIQKVGLYIPGGTAPLFSTVLMLGIPAQIAGCEQVIMCTPAFEGKIHPAILFAASLVGISKIFKIGGAQAIGAMAYGTASVPKVYKIFGPGNQYVTAAKQLIAKEGFAIDMPAGPSELAVWADDTAVPSYVAADLLSQAEHGADSQVVLVSTSEKLLENVQTELNKQVLELPRKEIAEKALKNSKLILVENNEIALELINEYAPEHLIIALDKTEEWAEKIVNAGSIFMGNFTPESAGDYASGTNHTLPTNGFARAYSGVSVDSFVKKITFQQISREGLKNIGKTIEIMAENEGLQAHKNAVSIRLK